VVKTVDWKTMDWETVDKMLKVLELYNQVRTDYLVERFFDYSSPHLLDEKIEVLSKLIQGVPPAEIPNYHQVLEKYPPEGEMWD